jgi:hypothetical protein
VPGESGVVILSGAVEQWGMKLEIRTAANVETTVCVRACSLVNR